MKYAAAHCKLVDVPAVADIYKDFPIVCTDFTPCEASRNRVTCALAELWVPEKAA
jgi:hypothetical protein